MFKKPNLTKGFTMNTLSDLQVNNNLLELTDQVSSFQVLERPYPNLLQRLSPPHDPNEYRSIVKKYIPHVLTLAQYLAPIYERLHDIESSIYDLSNYNHDGLTDDEIVYDTSIVPLFFIDLECQKDNSKIKLTFDWNVDYIWLISDSIIVDFEKEGQLETKANLSFRVMLEILNIKDNDTYFSFDISNEIELIDDLKQFEKNLIQKLDVKSVLKDIENNQK
jgi:hypothetical protein